MGFPIQVSNVNLTCEAHTRLQYNNVIILIGAATALSTLQLGFQYKYHMWLDFQCKSHMAVALSRGCERGYKHCLLYTSDAADDTPCVDLGGRRIF